MSIVLYWHPQSSATPVACALTELGVPHERVLIDLKAGDQRRPEFLALNPNGMVPTMTVHGAPMFETLAIQLWLGERYGVARGLWPAADTPERLLAMSWCAWAYVTYAAVVWRLFAVPQGAEAQRAAVLADLDKCLGVLDGHLAKQPWILGQDYSLADLVVGAVINFSASDYVGAPVAGHPHVQAWGSRVAARPAVQSHAS